TWWARSRCLQPLQGACATQPSSSSVDPDRPTATRSSQAFPSSPSSRASSPTAATTCSATTSVASDKAADAPKTRPSRIMPTVRWLRKRKDVDHRRLVVAGHSEGAPVALMAATNQKAIDGVISIAGPGTSGADLVLEQQQHVLEGMSLSAEQKQAKIDLQKKIQDAVISGKGLDDLPEDVRKQADTPWFRSLLTYDPAKVLARVRQPLLIIQGELDTQVSP